MKGIRLRCVVYAYALVLMTAIFTARTGAALAQAPQNDKDLMPPSVDQQLSTLNAKLNLNADQQAKIRTILEEQQQQSQQAITDGNTLSREDRRSNVRRVGVSTSSRIRDVLNDDQKVKFDRMEEERKKPAGS